jgi:hypothetical protein
MTTVNDGLYQYGGMPVTPGIPVPFTGTWFWVNPATGADGNDGLSPQYPFATLYKALSRMTAGKNDVCVLVGDGSTTGTARLSLALAQSIDSSATTGVLNWNKNACHLIGVTAPTGVAQRARIAPPSGTYTQATFGSGNFVTVSASGCYFSNFSLFHGFSTGGTNQICWTDTGSRNYYDNIQFGGMGDAASAADTGSRCLKIGSGGSGEHTFHRCTIGLDTVTRSVANASLELAGGTPRNAFYNCIFPMLASNAGVLSILATGAAAIDRWHLFDRCKFLNGMSSTGTAQTAIASMTSASPGGYLMMDGCSFVGNASTNWGDANAMANMYVNGGSPTAATNGNAVNPT